MTNFLLQMSRLTLSKGPRGLPVRGADPASMGEYSAVFRDFRVEGRELLRIPQQALVDHDDELLEVEEVVEVDVVEVEARA